MRDKKYTSEQLEEHRRLWEDALESGVYDQTTGYLENQRGYCCLGVACKVAELHGVPVKKDADGFILGDHLLYQTEVMEWLGLRSAVGSYREEECAPPLKLTNMNDSLRISFKSISKIIKSRPAGLFID